MTTKYPKGIRTIDGIGAWWLLLPGPADGGKHLDIREVEAWKIRKKTAHRRARAKH